MIFSAVDQVNNICHFHYIVDRLILALPLVLLNGSYVVYNALDS